jgi:viroplasmin and RNaseH domain-containing protein
MIKLKSILESIQNEVNLMGNCSKGVTWDWYVKRVYDPQKIYKVEKDSQLFGTDYNPIDSVTMRQELNILDPDFIEIKSSGTERKGTIKSGKYAKVKMLDSGLEGLLNLNAIRKPTDAETPKDSSEIIGAVIPGGTNSKEFAPSSLDLVGQSFDSKEKLAYFVFNNIKTVYPEPEYNEIKKYLHKCIEAVSGITIDVPLEEPLQEYSKNYSIQGDFKINSKDISILSKNFGEVLAGLHSLSTNKKAKKISFSPESNSPFWDYKIDTVPETFFSVKSKEGSSTGMANLNFILDKFINVSGEPNNLLIQRNIDEYRIIKSLMNVSKIRTTVSNIEEFYNTRLQDKKAEIIRLLNNMSVPNNGPTLKSLSQDDLNEWFNFVVANLDKNAFISGLNSVYQILGGSKTSDKTLGLMYDQKNSKLNGYIYYPMGSYIVKVLNKNAKAVELLNGILNYGSFAYQVTIDMDQKNNNLEIKTENFQNMSFRFSWNGLSNDPSNRPIGFISTKKKINKTA